jgi:hypothetical protein
MDIIEQAREIGKAIQKDERYLKMQLAVQAADGDKELQDLIGQYNLKRIALENEMQKQDRDNDKAQMLQQEMNGVYASIMKNPRMDAYNQVKVEFDGLMRRVNAIITQSAEGEDPETTDYVEHSCGGDCCSCGGCH